MSSETPPNPNPEIRRITRNKSQVLSGYGESKKKQLVWSEDDDIALLKGMVDYHLQKGSDPYDDMGKFLEYIKPFIHFDVVRKQVTDRLWKLKNKYVVRCKFNANNPHEAKLHELSKLIKAWGDGYLSGEILDDGRIEKAVKDKRGKVVNSDDDCQLLKDDSGVVDDVNIAKKKRKVVISGDGRCVDDEHTVVLALGDVNGAIKKSKNKGKVVINDDQYLHSCGKNDIVVVNDASGAKKKGNVVTSDDGLSVKDDRLLVDDVNRALKKGKKKGDVVISDDSRNFLEDVESAKKKDKKVGNIVDGQNVKMDDVIVNDDGNAKKKGEKSVKFVGSGSVTPKTAKENLKDDKVDGQNVNEDVVVVDDVGSAKMKGKKRVRVVGNESVTPEMVKENPKNDVVKDITSIYLHLSKTLEKHVPTDYVMRMISSIGKEKANELEEGWSEIRIMEVELGAEKLGVMNKQIQLILDAMLKLNKT